MIQPMVIIRLGIVAGMALTLSAPAQNFERASKVADYKYIFYLPGKEPSVAQTPLKAARLYNSPFVNRIALMNYTIQVSPYQDQNLQKTKGKGSWSTSKNEYGTVRYIPRILLTAKNAEITGDFVLVIEYFSCDLSDRSDVKREMVEPIPLVKLDKGESIVVDGMGVTFFKQQHEFKNDAGYSHKSTGGKELYGFIVSLFNADGALLFQQFSPQPLEKSCSKNLPEPLIPKEPQPYERPFRH